MNLPLAIAGRFCLSSDLSNMIISFPLRSNEGSHNWFCRIHWIFFGFCPFTREDGIDVVGVDNHNSYYDPQLKEDRLKRLLPFKNYSHYRLDICSFDLKDVFINEDPTHIVHLAAQAGVRYSIDQSICLSVRILMVF